MASLAEVLEKCEETASWFGMSITSLDQKNYLDDTPLHTVCTWGDIDAVKTLLDAGANVNALGDHEGVPLFNAIIGRNAGVVRLLLERGADPNVANSFGWTPLGHAETVGAPMEIIQLLRRAVK
ncbi:ankyrin repeat domain-containing protein [Methylocystis parvus]|nr:ankyrin repeat domain-containing protein [Methylocystis parvus]WBK01282.1 ankyrin repeat domain-containing protein [Methylocystis parvus OBBP]